MARWGKARAGAVGVVLALAVWFGVVSFGIDGRVAHAAPTEIVIGAVYPLTGPGAQVGLDAKMALETAAEVINGSYDLPVPLGKGGGLPHLGGAKIRLVFADHQSDPQKGRAEAERLITQEKVTALIGSYQSSVAATISQVADRYGVPYIAADNSSPSLNRNGLKWFFRPSAHDEMFTIAMFQFFKDMQGKTGKPVPSVSLVHEDTLFGTDSGNAQHKTADAAGIKVVADVKYRANSPSLTSEVQQLKAADGAVLMPSSYTSDAILLVKTMADLGYKPKAIVAQAAGFQEQAFFDAVGPAAEGIISRGSFSADLAPHRPAIKPVNELFRKKAGKDMNDNTAREFMALLVVGDAIDRAGSADLEKVREALVATDIPGEMTIMPWKRIKFDETGQNLDATPVLLQYVGGGWHTIWPFDLATQPPIWSVGQ
ncbi:MAG TPA: ABC transporter substrate-binding protein [Stellaceae bacterium]|nr:ABC transporter substrate-binding protein [Stellaceae bacterium]